MGVSTLVLHVLRWQQRQNICFWSSFTKYRVSSPHAKLRWSIHVQELERYAIKIVHTEELHFAHSSEGFRVFLWNHQYLVRKILDTSARHQSNGANVGHADAARSILADIRAAQSIGDPSQRALFLDAHHIRYTPQKTQNILVHISFSFRFWERERERDVSYGR